MRLGLAVVMLVVLVSPGVADAAVVFEVRAHTGLVGTEMEPFEFPLGLSLAVLAEHSIREQVSVRVGLGYRTLWSEESHHLMSPDTGSRHACSLRDIGSDERPTKFYGLQVGVRLGGSQVRSGSLVELGVGAGQSGREELEGDVFLSLAAGYAWRLSSTTEATLLVSERVHTVSDYSEISVAVGVGYLAQ